VRSLGLVGALVSRQAELTPTQRWLDQRELAERGYKRCESCGHLRPATVGRCRRRVCPAYSHVWAGDTMRKTRENLDVYGGLVAMTTVTAPGQDAGLVWDRSLCRHPPGEKCDGKRKGCKVEARAAQRWNDLSRDWWRKLNRVAKLRADRAIHRLGSEKKGGLLVYEWELQGRGVWHLHVVLGMETAIERAWAIEYVRALRELGPRYGFGWVDAKPLRGPRPAANGVSGYLSKYLAKRRPDGTLEVTETVRSAGRTLINYVSRNLTARSGCTMRALRNARIVWAWREGHFDDHRLDEWDYIVAVCLLDRLPLPLRGP
jgi:hypothetical protein